MGTILAQWNFRKLLSPVSDLSLSDVFILFLFLSFFPGKSVDTALSSSASYLAMNIHVCRLDVSVSCKLELQTDAPT